jgi:hypothetical protein
MNGNLLQIVSCQIIGQINYFKQQMTIVRLYHYSKSNQVSQCQGQDLKWAPPWWAGGGRGSGMTTPGSKNQTSAKLKSRIPLEKTFCT